MSAITAPAPRPAAEPAVPVPVPFDRTDLPQYSLRRILGIWALAAVPMGLLAWAVVPWMDNWIGGRDPFITSLLVCFNAGLLWMLAMTLFLVRREQGSLRWPAVRDALWLRAPRDPKTARVGGKVWWWVAPFVLLSAALEALPIDPGGPKPRDFPKAIDTDRVENFFSGNWGGFALFVAVAFLAPIVEELLFRGLLMPRMRKVFGKRDWVASGVMFTAYHVHQPWSMTNTLLTGLFGQAYPSRRFQSTWLGLATHTAPSFLMFGIVLALVL